MVYLTKQDLNTGVLPDKLLRIFISERCNYNCTFCCWEEPSTKSPKLNPICPENLRLVTEAMVESGCHNFQLTGGEPLLHRWEYLIAVVDAIASTPGVEQFWIVTNGSLLQDKRLCEQLYTAGLRRVNISIAAETNEKYQHYSRSVFTLDDALKAIRTASDAGIDVHVHTCLNADGVSTYEQLNTLLFAAQDNGAKNAFYFEVFSTSEIAQDFHRLYVNADDVTEEFLASSKWDVRSTDKGRPYFWNGKMRVYIPRKRAFVITDICRLNNCGDYCQGFYAAQLVNDAQGIAVRACQRIFNDDRNLFRIDDALLERRDMQELVDMFGYVWRYAYGQ